MLLKTEHLTGRSTHAYFLVAQRAAQLFQMFTFHPMHLHWLNSRLDDSSQHASRVFKMLRLLHGHSSTPCLVASSWACLTVSLLFLTDWRRKYPLHRSRRRWLVWPNGWTVSAHSSGLRIGLFSSGFFLETVHGCAFGFGFLGSTCAGCRDPAGILA